MSMNLIVLKEKVKSTMNILISLKEKNGKINGAKWMSDATSNRIEVD
jgi:hypothetical protein